MKKLLQGMVSRTCGRGTGTGNDVIYAGAGNPSTGSGQAIGSSANDSEWRVAA